MPECSLLVESQPEVVPVLLKIWVAWAVRLSASSAAEGSLPNILVEDGGDCCGRLICSGFTSFYKDWTFRDSLCKQ